MRKKFHLILKRLEIVYYINIEAIIQYTNYDTVPKSVSADMKKCPQIF